MHQTLVSRSDLAHLLCLSDARITQLIHTGVLPKPVKRGLYDLVASVRAYVTHLKTATHSTLAVERTRLTKAKADRAELDLRVRAAELVDVRAVQRQAFACARAARDALQALPDRLAALVSAEPDHTKNHHTLTTEIRSALEALADRSTVEGIVKEQACTAKLAELKALKPESSEWTLRGDEKTGPGEK